MAFDPTDPAQREIFCYHNGVRTVYADPEILARALYRAAPFEEVQRLFTTLYPPPPAPVLDPGGNPIPPEFLPPAPAPDPAAMYDAEERLCAIVVQAFGLKPLDDADGTGLLVPEILGVFLAFNAFVADAKKKAMSSLNSAAPTDSGPPGSS